MIEWFATHNGLEQVFLPPLHDGAAMAGLELPKYLGDAKVADLPVPNGHGS